MYNFLRSFFTKSNPKTAHSIFTGAFKVLYHFRITRSITKWVTHKRDYKVLEREVFGLTFPNPVGVAAGIDKNCELYNRFAEYGAGFIEVGSLTPEPQEGVEHPSAVRLYGKETLISMVGVGNCGVLNAIKNLKNERPEIIVAASITCNSSTPLDEVEKDFDRAFSLLYDFVDMFVINVGISPLEIHSDLEDSTTLADVMDKILDRRANMDILKPVLIKIAPDILSDQLEAILTYSMLSGVDGIVAGDSIRNNGDLVPKGYADVEGYVSGRPLMEKNIALVKRINEYCKGHLPVIGVGGIMTPDDAKAYLDAGASLVEVCTGLIYHGPWLINKILKKLSKRPATAVKS